ncbi:MAG: Coenzyme F420 hydrogenase/dehydrogenase, beta subunit C-terminal domain, partial [Clostridia bacterium]|nr:Coenzyme F420 hydrogenase/dehydrogenase, beta subunit C-terminal domain [Clostridia bacterium]
LFLKRNYDNLLCVDNICHSVPSPLIFKEYVNLVNSKYPSPLIKIDMRNKENGWSHTYRYKYFFADGSSIGDESLKLEHWGKLFFSGLITRPSCNACHFTSFSRVGDITVADFWDDKGKRPDAFSKNGTSLFIVNTDAGSEILNKIAYSVDKWELSKEEALQPCLVSPVASNPQKDEFWLFYANKGFYAAYQKFFATPLKLKMKMNIILLLKACKLYPLLKSIKNTVKK